MRPGVVDFIVAMVLLPAAVAFAAGPTTSIQGEYLMTLYVPIVEAHEVDDTLRVVNHPDGWVEGPQIKGKIIPPSSDALGSGVLLKTTTKGAKDGP